MVETTQKKNSMKQLNDWFSIPEEQYMWYILQGYEIRVDTWRITWELDGKAHREDGPALIWSDGSKSWWLNGKLYNTEP